MHFGILTQYYPPETGAPQNRLSHLAEHFVRRGHRDDVREVPQVLEIPEDERPMRRQRQRADQHDPERDPARRTPEQFGDARFQVACARAGGVPFVGFRHRAPDPK